jgi:LysM repeat protein
MVKDHQSPVFVRTVFVTQATNESAPPTWLRWRFRFCAALSGSRQTSREREDYSDRRCGAGSAKRLWLIGLLLLSCGCQSGLVDSGRSRRNARPSPALNVPPTNGQPPLLNGPAIPSGTTSGQGTSSAPVSLSSPGNSLNWDHVSRQSAATVVKMPATDEAKAKYHTVQTNETWSSLARSHGLSVKQLADANGIDPSNLLKAGQIVYIPDAGKD